MALVVPNSPANYKTFFKELAEKHINIRHDEENKRKNFTIISLQTAMKGFSDDNIKAFSQTLRTTAAKKQTESENNCIMVLVELNGEADEDKLRINKKEFTGSFFILTVPMDDKAETVDEVKEICYQTGKDCLAVFKAFFDKNQVHGKFTATTDESTTIHNHNLHGWRFDFGYYTNNAYCFSEENFDELEIPAIPLYPPPPTPTP